MKVVTATVEMTAAEFLALEPHDSVLRRELIDGELVVSQPTWSHGRAQIVISTALELWTSATVGRGRACPPIDVGLDDANVYAPDVVWYRDRRVPQRRDPRPYPVPDIVVEVRSPSTWRLDIGVKKANYETCGAAELWLVDTAADVVLVFRRSKPQAPRFDVSLELTAADTLTSPLLPGFTLAVGDIFAG